jgi:pyruvate dehydrogenase E2 component (dihydrolipoamide acetyltransferase)
MTDILMPALSPTMEEGVLAKWIVKVGDAVHAGDIIAEIETDKATMEVEAVDDGVLTEILVPAGAEGVKVNTPIARLRAEGEPETPSALHAEEEPAPAQAAAPAPAAAAEPGNVQTSAPPPPKDPPAGSKPPAEPAGEPASRIFASPLARRIAADRGLNLARVKGTGPHGRIVKADVADLNQEAPAAKQQPEAGAEAPAPRVAMTLEQMGIPPGSYDLLPLDGMRKTIARRMSESFRDVPHFPLTIDLEIDRLLDARGRLNHALSARGVKVSVNDLVIKACALALKAVPDANASYTPDGIALHHHADVAVAVAIEGGLITPIIRAAETRTLADISSVMKDLAERARTRKLKPEEFQGGTFSLSNLGMMGIKSFASIINEPQGCILSVGAGEKRPVVHGDQLAIATVMTATLTCDHRVVDGAIGARWLQAFKDLIEDPILMLA